MAFVPSQIPEEEQNKFAPTGQTTPNPIPPQSGGSAGVGGQAKNTPPGVGSSTQFGSNAAKLSDYLAVNKPQIENWGNQIAGNLTQNYTNTMNDVNQGVGAFNSQVQKGTPSADANFISQAAANPTDFVKNPDNVSKFQQAYQGNYTGPSNIESTDQYQNLNNEVNSAVQDAGLVNSPSGLGSYLNSKMGGGNQETPGMQALDTALLQGNPTAQTAIKSAAQPYQNLQSYLAGQTSQANTNATNAKNTTAQNAAQYQKQFAGEGGVLPNFISQLNKEVAAGQKAAPSMRDAKGNPLNPNLVNMANAATPNDYATAKALQALMGSDYQGALNPNDVAQAGTWNPYLGNFTTNPTTGAMTATQGVESVASGTTIPQETQNLLNQQQAVMQNVQSQIQRLTDQRDAALAQTKDPEEQAGIRAGVDSQIQKLNSQLTTAQNEYNQAILSIGGTLPSAGI